MTVVASVWARMALADDATPDWIGTFSDVPSLVTGYGYSVSSAGDVNGDGFDDVVVGAPYCDCDVIAEGAMLLYYGHPSGLPQEPDAQLDADHASALAGFAVSTAGDVDGDGYDDVIMGAPGVSTTLADVGAAYVFLGGDAGLDRTPAWSTMAYALCVNVGETADS